MSKRILLLLLLLFILPGCHQCSKDSLETSKKNPGKVISKGNLFLNTEIEKQGWIPSLLENPRPFKQLIKSNRGWIEFYHGNLKAAAHQFYQQKDLLSSRLGLARVYLEMAEVAQFSLDFTLEIQEKYYSMRSSLAQNQSPSSHSSSSALRYLSLVKTLQGDFKEAHAILNKMSNQPKASDYYIWQPLKALLLTKLNQVKKAGALWKNIFKGKDEATKQYALFLIKIYRLNIDSAKKYLPPAKPGEVKTETCGQEICRQNQARLDFFLSLYHPPEAVTKTGDFSATLMAKIYSFDFKTPIRKEVADDFQITYYDPFTLAAVEKALLMSAQATLANDDQHFALLMRGIIAYRLGDLKAARKLLEQFLGQDKNQLSPWKNQESIAFYLWNHIHSPADAINWARLWLAKTLMAENKIIEGREVIAAILKCGDNPLNIFAVSESQLWSLNWSEGDKRVENAFNYLEERETWLEEMALKGSNLGGKALVRQLRLKEIINLPYKRARGWQMVKRKQMLEGMEIMEKTHYKEDAYRLSALNSPIFLLKIARGYFYLKRFEESITFLRKNMVYFPFLWQNLEYLKRLSIYEAMKKPGKTRGG